MTSCDGIFSGGFLGSLFALMHVSSFCEQPTADNPQTSEFLPGLVYLNSSHSAQPAKTLIRTDSWVSANSRKSATKCAFAHFWVLFLKSAGGKPHFLRGLISCCLGAVACIEMHNPRTAPSSLGRTQNCRKKVGFRAHWLFIPRNRVLGPGE